MRISAKRNEIALLSITSLMSFTANLPISSLNNFVDRRLLLITLGVSVIIALFQYLQLLLPTVVFASSIGANLPPRFASAIGVYPPALTAALAIILSAVLLNRFFKLLPASTHQKNDCPMAAEESRKFLLAAIAKGNQAALLQLLAANVEINFYRDGTAPILLAAEKGYSDITQILIRHGADFRICNAAGLTPLEIALSKKFVRTSEILYLAEKEYPQHSKAQ